LSLSVNTHSESSTAVIIGLDILADHKSLKNVT